LENTDLVLKMREKKTKKPERKALFNNAGILGSYLKEIGRIPLLSREEEEVIARKAVNGDQAARNRLVGANLRFVVKIAKKYRCREIPFLDLINEGNIGLMEAVEHYDVDKGYHFISYAKWWIRRFILAAIYEKSRLIRLPMHWNGYLTEIDRAGKTLQGNNRLGAEEKVADLIGIGTERVRDFVIMGQKTISLDKPVKTDGIASLADTLESEYPDSPEDNAIYSALKDEIEKVLGTLETRKADIIRLYYGLGNNMPMPLPVIGIQYNLSKERVRQIRNKAIEQLQSHKLRHRLEAYVG
jgi:RNA polymerase primary sigma factor